MPNSQRYTFEQITNLIMPQISHNNIYDTGNNFNKLSNEENNNSEIQNGINNFFMGFYDIMIYNDIMAYNDVMII